MTVAATFAPARRMDMGAALGMAMLATMGLLLVVMALSVLAIGAPYYILSDAARAEHWLHPWLRSGGIVGLWLGVVGAALMSGILVYRVRKLLGIRPWLGSMTWWLRFHLMCGVLGPVLIILHGGLTLPSSKELDEALALARDLDQRPASIFGLIRLDLEVRRRRRKIGTVLGRSNLPREQRELAHTLLVDQLLLKRNLEGRCIGFLELALEQ